MSSTLVLLSGGLKSAAVAADLKKRERAIVGLFWEYGQRNLTNERAAAVAVAKQLNFPLHTLKLSHLAEVERPGKPWTILGGDLPPDQINGAIPGLLPALITLSAHDALLHECEFIAIGASGTSSIDHQEMGANLVNHINTYFALALSCGIRIQAPLMAKSAEACVRFALDLPGSERLIALTTSCYIPGDVRCGSCKGCKRRAVALKIAGVKDSAWAPGKARIDTAAAQAASERAASEKAEEALVAPVIAKKK